VVGEVGAGTRPEQLALGEVPNLAARLQGLADPDTVVISAATYRLIEGYFECDWLGEQDLRGVSQPVVVYRVWHESGIQNRLDLASRRGLTPLVGREQEVGLLLDRWEQATNRQGQVILLSGEAGIGKSRLVQVLKDHIADEPHTRLECRSSPYFTNSALYPIIEMVQGALRFQTDDTPEQKLEKLKENLSQYHQPLEETVPLFGALLSVPIPEDCYPTLNLTPQRQRQKTLEAILAIILELAERQPVLFILEDLHWTDPTTLEFIELLMDQTPMVSIDALFTCRPEFQPSWSHRSYLSEMSVNRLSRDQIERMAKQVVGEKPLPDEIVQQLVGKTDGVPLYVEEMIKAVLESGVLKETNGQYELAGSLALLSIPATLQDSLMARLDRLVTAKAVAQYAAVLGRQFTYDLLSRVSPLDAATLQHELARLVEAEIVYQRGLPPQATYAFKHALIQDAAYESLLRSTRQQYHQRIAQVLEAQFPETVAAQPELIAHHCTEAGLIEQAVGHWQRAGQQAVEHSAYAEAVSHLTAALDLLSTLPESRKRSQQELVVQMTLGRVLEVVQGNGHVDVGTAYTRAWVLCQRLGEPLQTTESLWGLSIFHYLRRELQAAYERGTQCLAAAHRLRDAEGLIGGQQTLGLISYGLGEFVASRDYLEQGIALYHPRQHATLIRRYTNDLGLLCYSCLTQTLWVLGYPTQALARRREMVAIAQTLAHPYSVGLTLYWAVKLHFLRREIEAMLDLLDTLMPLVAEQAFVVLSALSRILRGWALVASGQGAAGLSELREGIEHYYATGGRSVQELALFAEATAKTGQVEEALGLVEDAYALVDKTGDRGYEAEFHHLRGRLLLQQSPDNHPEAEPCFQRAIRIAQRQHAKSWELRATTSLARLWQSQGKRQEAHDLLAPVYEWFTEGFDTADLKDAKALLDELAT